MYPVIQILPHDNLTRSNFLCVIYSWHKCIRIQTASDEPGKPTNLWTLKYNKVVKFKTLGRTKVIRYRKSARTVLTGKQSITLITLHGLILNKFNFSECSSQNLFSLKQITAKYKNFIKRQITSLGIVLLGPKRKLDLDTVIWKDLFHMKYLVLDKQKHVLSWQIRLLNAVKKLKASCWHLWWMLRICSRFLGGEKLCLPYCIHSLRLVSALPILRFDLQT